MLSSVSAVRSKPALSHSPTTQTEHTSARGDHVSSSPACFLHASCPRYLLSEGFQLVYLLRSHLSILRHSDRPSGSFYKYNQSLNKMSSLHLNNQPLVYLLSFPVFIPGLSSSGTWVPGATFLLILLSFTQICCDCCLLGKAAQELNIPCDHNLFIGYQCSLVSRACCMDGVPDNQTAELEQSKCR